MATVYATCSACHVTLQYFATDVRRCAKCHTEGTLSIDETQSTPDGFHVDAGKEVRRRVSLYVDFYHFQAVVEQCGDDEPRLRLFVPKDRRCWNRDEWDLIHHLGEEAWRIWRAQFGKRSADSPKVKKK